jgi:hypothetical protein
MRSRRFVVILAIIASLWILSRLERAKAEGQQMLRWQFAETVTTVRTGKDSTVRTDAAQHLFELTRGIRAKQLDDESIAEIASLLDGSDDSVRYWVARCLGNFGARARIAVPKLMGLLPKADCLTGDKTSASGIRFALEQMGVAPPPTPTCNASK